MIYVLLYCGKEAKAEFAWRLLAIPMPCMNAFFRIIFFVAVSCYAGQK